MSPHLRPAPTLSLSVPVLGSISLLALVLGAAGQDPGASLPEPPAPLPPGAAALVDGEVITLAEYERFLVDSYGRGPLRTLIRERLLFKEAARLGVAVPSGEAASLAEEFWASFRDARHGGDEAAAQAELEREGFDKQTFLANQRRQEEQRLLTDAIVRATRVPTEEDVRRRFEHEYGLGGEHVTVRHVFFSRGRLLSELKRDQAPPERMTGEALDATLLARAEDTLAALQAGGDFAELARERSHDLSAKVTGGAIPEYNYLHYGEALAEAVRATAVGVPAGPIRSTAGIHVFEVTSRTLTKLGDVRADVLAALAAEPASGEERSELDQRLLAAARITTY